MTWKEDDVFKTIANPIHAGIGPFPATVNEDQWLQANAQLIKKYGAKKGFSSYRSTPPSGIDECTGRFNWSALLAEYVSAAAVAIDAQLAEAGPDESCAVDVERFNSLHERYRA